MKTQEIGQSGMIASRVALGVMRMDALDAADAARTVAVAHDSGIDYFDTADIYGFHDHAAHASSKRFGQAWKDAGLDRQHHLHPNQVRHRLQFRRKRWRRQRI